MRTSLCVLCVSWSKMSRDDMSPGDPPPHHTRLWVAVRTRIIIIVTACKYSVII